MQVLTHGAFGPPASDPPGCCVAVQVVLPPSVGESLMNQGAGERNGAMLFELRLPGSSGLEGSTHAGVFEFTAPEGTILLPRKVVQSLWGSLDAQPTGNVVVTYK